MYMYRKPIEAVLPQMQIVCLNTIYAKRYLLSPCVLFEMQAEWQYYNVTIYVRDFIFK